jgi:hypothetical protein
MVDEGWDFWDRAIPADLVVDRETLKMMLITLTTQPSSSPTAEAGVGQSRGHNY